MINRIIGVLKLDVETYEAIEHDEGATMQAAMVVLVVAIVAAIGAGFAANALGGLADNLGGIEGFEDLPSFGAQMSPVGSAVSAFINTFIGWILWSYITYFVGTRMFDGKATPQQMMRVIGFAMVPRVLSIIPCFGLIGWIYSLVTGFVGIRQGLDLDNGKTALTIVISIVGVLVASFVVGLILSPIFALAG